jgi:hypothetical protein
MGLLAKLIFPSFSAQEPASAAEDRSGQIVTASASRINAGSAGRPDAMCYVLWHFGGVSSGTYELFSNHLHARSFFIEQFWGRAARASSDSKESGRLLNF